MNTVRGTCGVGTEIESVESDNYRGNAMKTTINRDGLIWAICALAVLALGSALAVRPAGGGINGGGIYFGSIDEFGSIFVNGVEFETTGASILVDGVPSTQADLRLGQVVTVDGVVNLDEVTGNAITVRARTDLRGVVTAVDPVTLSVTVLGQRVRVEGATRYGSSLTPAAFAGLAVGTAVEGSGHRNAAGDLVATRIDAAAPAAERVVGTVSALQPGLLRFNVGALSIDYSSLSRLEGSLDDGARVEVKGVALSAFLFDADEIEVLPGELGGAGTVGSIEGRVTLALSGGVFAIGGQPVGVNGTTVFVDGGAADLLPDTRVEAEGHVDAAGVLVAEQVTIVLADVARAHGVVTATPRSGGALTVNGLAIQVPAGTNFEDRESRQGRFGLADIRIGDVLEVRGAEPPQRRSIRADMIQRIRDDGRTWIEGVVSSVRAGSVVLLDTVVETNARTAYEDAAGRRLTARAFMAQAAGREVKARGAYRPDGSLLAAQLALKN